MRLAVKLWLVYFCVCLLTGTVLGLWLYNQFPFLLYFIVPFTPFFLIGAVPASFGIIAQKLESGLHRLLLAGLYVLGIVGAFGAFPAYRNAHEAPADQGPYLSWAGEPKTTMTVSWTTANMEAGAVEWQKAGEDEFRLATDGMTTQFHHLTLDGLSPGTAYTYRVPALGSQTHTFTTAPVSKEDFSFAVYGDNRPWMGISRHDAVIRAMARAERPDDPFRFLISTGDLVESPGVGYGWQWYVFLRAIGTFAPTRPYLVGLGNHEARGGTEIYDQYFDFGSDDPWYSLTYAGIHFVFLSTQHDITQESEQRQWLEADLTQHAEESRFTIVSFHKPMVTYSTRESDRRDSSRYEQLMPTFMSHDVDLVFSGHVHSYEHLLVDGIHCVTTGGGGVVLWDKPEVGRHTIRTETTYHYCVVSVEGDQMRIRAERLDGSIIDEFMVN